jgi:NDP-sugar pyrophosphorylase family protein
MSSLFVHEPEILGTGGGIRQVWRALGEPDPLLVMNGDVLFEPDLIEALRQHIAHDAVATMVLREVPDADRYGAIEIDAGARVRRLLGAPDAQGPLRKLMFSGVHVLSARAVASLPERGCVIRQGYRAWIDAGLVVAGFVDAAPWLELGTPADYAEAQLGLLARLDSGTTGHRSLVHAAAQIDAEAHVAHSIVGADSRVDGPRRLERVIVWPGAHVTGDLRDAIVTTSGRVVSW